MCSASPQPQSRQWLLDSGLKRLELLFRAILYQPAEPILIADEDRCCRDASSSAGKLLGLPRNRIIGHRIDDFLETGFRPQIERLWPAFLQKGEQRGTLRILGAGGIVRDVEYAAKVDVLPSRHLLELSDKPRKQSGRQPRTNRSHSRAPTLDLHQPRRRQIASWVCHSAPVGAGRVERRPSRRTQHLAQFRRRLISGACPAVHLFAGRPAKAAQSEV